MNSTNQIEEKLRNLQMNLSQGRSDQQQLTQLSVYFPRPTTQKTSTSNIYSTYIENNTKDETQCSYSRRYHDEYVPYDYHQRSDCYYLSNRMCQPSISLSNDENLPDQHQHQWNDVSSTFSYSPMIIEQENDENSMKTDFVHFRKKQFETGHVENLLPTNEEKTKKKIYSEKMKYENEWNRLTASTAVESVMERAAHFEQIDPEKFPKFKSKINSSSQEILTDDDQYSYQHYFKPIQPTINSSHHQSISTYQIPTANEIHSIEYHSPHSHFISLPTQSNRTSINENSRLSTDNSSHLRVSSSPSGTHLIRQNSYINAVRSNPNSNDRTDFVHLHVQSALNDFNLETPILRRKVGQYVLTPKSCESEMKQRRTSYLLATDQRIFHRTSFLPSTSSSQYDYSQSNEQNLRTPQQQQHQSQAIQKLKNFFGEGTPQVTHALDHRATNSPRYSTIHPSKSLSYFDPNATFDRKESIPLRTMPDDFEAAKEGILYCKTVLKDGRRAADRSWRGAWAVLRRGALFLGKEKKHGLLIPLSCESFPINLHHAEVELASDYIKKPRVFKITTSNQCVFLFQAPDIQSLNEWLEHLNEHCRSAPVITMESKPEEKYSKKKEKYQRKSTSSLPPAPSTSVDHSNDQNFHLDRKSSPTNLLKPKTSLRSPSLKRSPSLRFRKSQKPSISQPTQSIPSLINGINSPSHHSPRRSFVKSIVKKGLRTLKSSSSLLTSQMSGQIYDESSGESLSSTTTPSNLSLGMNFSIDLEECESSSISRFIPIVVEILTRLIELRGIHCQGIYRHAGGLTAVNWLINEFDKGTEKIDFKSERWYDVKAIASTLKTFFAKLPDSLLSSKMTSLCVEASRIENHRDRLIQLKKLIHQLDQYRYETLKYLCAHFRRVTAHCQMNKIDARNLAIIFGPTLIWDSNASLQSNLVDNPEKIRIIESFILYYEWFFQSDQYDQIPVEINPQMPKTVPVTTLTSTENDLNSNSDTKPSDIIQEIVRAAKRRWSSPLILDPLSSLTKSSDQPTSKPIHISVKRNSRDEDEERNSSRSRSVDSSIHYKSSTAIVSSSTDSAVYSISDRSSSKSTTMRKPSQSLKDISHLFHYFTLSSNTQTNGTNKSKTLTNMRRKKLRKKLQQDTFLPPDEHIYQSLSNTNENEEKNSTDFFEQTSLLKSKLIEHENILQKLKEQLNQVDQQLILVQDSSTSSSLSSQRQLIKRRHTFNSLIDFNCFPLEKQKLLIHPFSSLSTSSLFALQLL